MNPKKIFTLFDDSKIYDFYDCFLRIYKNGRIEKMSGFSAYRMKNKKKIIEKIKGFVLIDEGVVN